MRIQTLAHTLVSLINLVQHLLNFENFQFSKIRLTQGWFRKRIKNSTRKISKRVVTFFGRNNHSFLNSFLSTKNKIMILKKTKTL